MSRTPQARWRAVPDDTLVWRDWDDEVVVFIQRTGSTHLLGDLGSEIFRRLIAAEGGATVEALAAGLADDPSGADAAGWTRRWPRYYPILRGVASRNRISLDRRRPVGPRTRTPAGRPRPPAANRSRRLPHPVPAACGRPRDRTALRGIPDRGGRELCRFSRRVGRPAQCPPVAAAAGAVSSSTGILPFAPLPLDQAFPMLEWGLNWCVSAHCHQYLIFHAAVVEKSGPRADPSGAPRVRQEHAVRGPRQSWLAAPVR